MLVVVVVVTHAMITSVNKRDEKLNDGGAEMGEKVEALDEER